uniref:Uncharacterized protein n=1 Tax=Arundo donax TaxID=35708 RepID=A0A0A8Y049_ARUDO
MVAAAAVGGARRAGEEAGFSGVAL